MLSTVNQVNFLFHRDRRYWLQLGGVELGQQRIERGETAKENLVKLVEEKKQIETLKRTLILKKVIKRRATFAQDSDLFCDSWVRPPTMTIRKIWSKVWKKLKPKMKNQQFWWLSRGYNRNNVDFDSEYQSLECTAEDLNFAEERIQSQCMVW